MHLKKLGWNSFFEAHFEPFRLMGYTVGRIVSQYKHIYRVYTEHGQCLGDVTGKMRYEAIGRHDYPVVGDWVVIKERKGEGKAVIHAVLPRISKFSRKTAGDKTEEQIVAANINTVFLVTSLNQEFNLRRMERYLMLAWESGAKPVIILSKADLVSNSVIEEKISQLELISLGVPIHVVSAINKQGLEELDRYLEEGNTAALLGSSGVGKSTLINCLLGEETQRVQEIRQGDDKGKHTTTFRELFFLPQGACMIDTPGMRELQLWGTDEGLKDTFEDIEQLSSMCQFIDCQHLHEPNCAVKQAVKEGKLDENRLNNYRKMMRELEYLHMKTNKKAQLEEKDRWKKLSKEKRRRNKR
ncbi:ribosome small subunit-dependent GTPase A [Thermicanus aegyptius]|uniref:ribosome small subunit-dependent GTPase A n=1 Tax=Thermicanus aegyptius TaxID=94009 RepID=UPI000419B133|nr:ribosome small subunit-dependent GTPase A [Thermicanus aegyptius]